jgi:uncharacterized BrkB/YihY/UPF0761 family membrane protein
MTVVCERFVQLEVRGRCTTVSQFLSCFGPFVSGVTLIPSNQRVCTALGGFIAFMTWFYWTSFFFIAGAELNAELAKGTKAGPLRQKDKTSPDATLDRAA